DFLELGVDDVLLAAGRAASARLLCIAIDLLSKACRRGAQRLELGFDRGLAVALQRLLELRDRGLDLRPLLRRHLVAEILQRLLRRVHERIALVAQVHELAELRVLGGVGLGLLDHPLDLLLGETGRRLDHDLLLFARRLVLRGDVQDAVRVDVERDLDLRHAGRRGRNTGEVELAERLVVGRAAALALEHVDRDRCLVVLRRREDLRRLRRDRRVLLDQLRHHAALRLDTERQRRNVEEQHVLDLARERAGLDRGAERDALVRVDVLTRLVAEELRDLLLDLRHARLTADEDHVVDVADRETGVLQRDLARLERTLDQILDERLELRARQADVEMLRPRRVRRDVRQVDIRLLPRRKLDLRLLRGFLQTLHRERILRDVDAALFLELLREVLDDAVVEVLAAEEGIAVRREHLELMLAVDLGDLDDRDIERAAAEVVYRDLTIAALLVETVRERRRRRLVDDALHLEARDAARVLRRLALSVVEVRRHRDHGLGDLLAEIVLGRLLHLREHARGDLGRRHPLAVDLDPRVAVVRLHDLVGDQMRILLDHGVVEAPADEALDREEGVARIGHGLALRRLADEHLAVLRERNDRRRRAIALAVLDDLRRTAFHDRDARVGRAQIDAYYSSHCHTSARLDGNPLDANARNSTFAPVGGGWPVTIQPRRVTRPLGTAARTRRRVRAEAGGRGARTPSESRERRCSA